MKKRYFMFLCILFIIGFGNVKAQIIEDGVYIIQSALDSDKVVDLHAGNTANGTNIELFSYNKGDNQKWTFKHVDDDYYIISSYDNDNQVMEVSGALKTQGSNVSLWHSNNGNHQRWLIKDAGDGYYNIVDKNSDLFLDVAGASVKNGTNINVWINNGGDNQKFKFKKVELNVPPIEDGVYDIVSSLGDDFRLNVSGGVTSGSNVNITENKNIVKQKWQVKHLKNGYYAITSFINNMSLDVAFASTSKGANVQLWTYNGNNNQKWLIKDAGDGYYNIISKNGGLYIDVSGGVKKTNANINMWINNGGDNQKFKFVLSNEVSDNIEGGIYEITSALDEKRNFTISGPAINNSKVVFNDKTSLPLQKWSIRKKENGYYVISSAVNNSKVLDVANSGQKNGTNVLLWQNNNSSNQEWILQESGDGYYNVISKCNGLVLDISGGISKNGAGINVWDLNGGGNQKFKFVKDSIYDRTIADGDYSVTSQLDGSKFLTASSNNVSNSTANNQDVQKWTFKYHSDGYYTISLYNSDSFLSVSNSSKDKGSKVVLESENNNDNQKWIIEEAGNGYYIIVSKCNGLTLDISGGRPINNAGLDTWLNHGGTNQNFKLISAVFGQNTLNDGLYTISSNFDSNMVIGLDLELAFNGAVLQLETNNDLDSQKWYVNNLGNGYYKITSALSGGKVVDVSNYSYMNGTDLKLYNDNSGVNQQWVIKDVGDGYYSIISSYSAMVVTVSNQEENAKILINDNSDSLYQKFKFTETTLSGSARIIDDGYYTLETALDSSKVIDVHGALKVNGTNVEMYKSNGGNNQIWYFKYLNNGFYSVTSAMNPILSLDVYGAGMTPGTNVEIYKNNGNANQQWAVRNVGDDYYSLVSKQNGLSLEAVSSDNSSNVHVNKSYNNKNQKFKLRRITTTKKYTGIDVSAHQGNIDFKKLSDAGLGFAIIRAGFGGNWTNQDDKYFKKYVSECENYNIPYGLYLYSYAKDTGSSDVSASAEAKHMLRLLNEIAFYPNYHKPTLGTKVFIDIEDNSVASASKNTLTGVANQFCDIMEKSGYECGVYASKDWLTYKLDAKTLVSKYDIWLAEWGQNNKNYGWALNNGPTYNLTGIKFWQFTSNGSLNGIDTRVDLNIGYDIFD